MLQRNLGKNLHVPLITYLVRVADKCPQRRTETTTEKNRMGRTTPQREELVIRVSFRGLK